MARLNTLYQLTIDLKELLMQKVTPQQRDDVLLKMNQLIEARSIEMQKITPPYTEKEKEIGQKIVQLNHTIEQRMNLLFDELKQEMKQLNKQKKSNRSYINPYGKITSTDGMYLDSRQ